MHCVWPGLLLVVLPLAACGSEGGASGPDASGPDLDAAADAAVDFALDPFDGGIDSDGSSNSDTLGDLRDTLDDLREDGDGGDVAADPVTDAADLDHDSTDLPAEDAAAEDSGLDPDLDAVADLAPDLPTSDTHQDPDAESDPDSTVDLDAAADPVADEDAATDAPVDADDELTDGADADADVGNGDPDVADADMADPVLADFDAPDPDVADTAGDTIVDAAADVTDLAEADLAPSCELPPPIDDGRYAGMEELRDEALFQALHDLIDDHNGLSYDAARDIMYVDEQIDVDADGFIECLYTGIRIEADGTRSPDGAGTQITTEHTWPRSDGAASFPAEGDIHHLVPAIEQANGQRGSLEFGYVACGETAEPVCPYAQGGSRRGPSELDGSQVFEVRPIGRGNVARAHFYFSVRYELSIPEDEEAVLRAWHCEDPPDEVERARNDAIEVHQANRNPFLDHPEWVDHIADF